MKRWLLILAFAAVVGRVVAAVINARNAKEYDERMREKVKIHEAPKAHAAESAGTQDAPSAGR